MEEESDSVTEERLSETVDVAADVPVVSSEDGDGDE